MGKEEGFHQGERVRYLATDRIRIDETEQAALAFSITGRYIMAGTTRAPFPLRRTLLSTALIT